MKALIVAAGQGTRLRSVARSKPLALIRGVPLIERVIEAAHHAGIDEFVVVTGYEGARLEAFLKRLAARRDITITPVRNLAWKRSNGLSVLAAERLLDDRFVLLMADHLFDPAVLADLIVQACPPDSVILAIDRRLDNPLVDLEDVTRVQTDSAGNIDCIGKLIPNYNAFDTGLFLAGRPLIEALHTDVNAGGMGSISAGMTQLALQGRAQTYDIGDRFWLDVDDATAHGQAERLSA